MVTLATTSAIPAVKRRLVELIRWKASAAGDPVQVAYLWPGRETVQECIFLGRSPLVSEWESAAGQSQIATVKAARQQRQETFTVPVTCWAFSPGAPNEEAAAVETRGFAIAAHVENVLADYPRLRDVDGLPATPGTFDVAIVPAVQIEQRDVRLGPYSGPSNGLVSSIEFTLSVATRLA